MHCTHLSLSSGHKALPDLEPRRGEAKDGARRLLLLELLVKRLELLELELLLPRQRVQLRPAVGALVEPGAGGAAAEGGVEVVPQRLRQRHAQLVHVVGPGGQHAAVVAEEVGVVDGARLGERLELVHPLPAHPELHQARRLAALRQEGLRPLPHRLVRRAALPVEEDVRLRAHDRRRVHLRHRAVVELVPDE